MSLSYFAWKGDVYECEVTHHVQREEHGKMKWYAVVRPTGPRWLQIPGMQINGHMAIPANVVRQTREEATADITIGALRNFRVEEA